MNLQEIFSMVNEMVHYFIRENEIIPAISLYLESEKLSVGSAAIHDGDGEIWIEGSQCLCRSP